MTDACNTTDDEKLSTIFEALMTEILPTHTHTNTNTHTHTKVLESRIEEMSATCNAYEDEIANLRQDVVQQRDQNTCLCQRIDEDKAENQRLNLQVAALREQLRQDRTRSGGMAREREGRGEGGRGTDRAPGLRHDGGGESTREVDLHSAHMTGDCHEAGDCTCDEAVQKRAGEGDLEILRSDVAECALMEGGMRGEEMEREEAVAAAAAAAAAPVAAEEELRKSQRRLAEVQEENDRLRSENLRLTQWLEEGGQKLRCVGDEQTGPHPAFPARVQR